MDGALSALVAGAVDHRSSAAAGYRRLMGPQPGHGAYLYMPVVVADAVQP